MKRILLTAVVCLVFLAAAPDLKAADVLGSTPALGNYFLEVQTGWNRTLEMPIHSARDLVAIVPFDGKRTSAVKVVPKLTANGVEVEIYAIEGRPDTTSCANIDSALLTPIGAVRLAAGDSQVVRSPLFLGAPPMQLRLKESSAGLGLNVSLAGCDENSCRCPGHTDCCNPDPGKCCRPHGNCGECCGTPTQFLVKPTALLDGPSS